MLQIMEVPNPTPTTPCSFTKEIREWLVEKLRKFVHALLCLHDIGLTGGKKGLEGCHGVPFKG